MVSTSGGLTHSGPSILPRSPFVAPSGARFIRTIYYVERGVRRISTPMHTTLLRSPHTDVLLLPPVALQKGKRDAQVQFRGRRHTRPVG
ncbi:hypothetical protein T05_9153 [Trichinella murrelli]|uniref:Uncharacterized protein n=1 Tax=Trichinella murrelli TaxID=144512 RepID=A0A0V0SUM4_9BILA|nr:hypothetical protein T05_9153 [Trichinella murrelli]